MEKICMNCKHCSFNIKVKEFEKANIFKKIIMILKGEAFFDLEYKYPKCMNPEVFHIDFKKDLVFGNELKKENLFCPAARSCSCTCNNEEFHTCGPEGKYFEEDK